MKLTQSTISTLKIVVPYGIFSALWILLSDLLLESLFPDTATFARISIYKGWFFVLVTTILLVMLVRRHFRRLQAGYSRMEDRVNSRTSELAEAKSFLDALVDHISSPVFYKGADLRFRGCNRAYEEAFGISKKEFIGKTVLDLDYLPYADRIAYQQEDSAMIKMAQTVRREAVIPFVDGLNHQTLYSVSGFRLANGKPGGLVGIIVDITHIKETETELREAKLAAEAADRLKSAFLANMSHELRTPLNSIIGFSSILLSGLPGQINQEQKKQLTMVKNSSEHLLALINDVLDLSKIEAGQLQIHHETFILQESLERVIHTLEPLALKKKLKIEREFSKDLGDWLGDQRRFEQVLLNLLSNAVKFTQQGWISVNAKLQENQLTVSVTDTGPGIAQEDLLKLWKPFTQVETGLARLHEGTGLGLSICKRLVELMGGSIYVDSKPGLGSTFSFRIPPAEKHFQF